MHSEGSLQSALNTASIWDGVSKFRNQRNRERKQEMSKGRNSWEKKRQIWVVGSREKGMEEFPSCPDESKQFSVKTADNWVQL